MMCSVLSASGHRDTTLLVEGSVRHAHEEPWLNLIVNKKEKAVYSHFVLDSSSPAAQEAMCDTDMTCFLS